MLVSLLGGQIWPLETNRKNLSLSFPTNAWIHLLLEELLIKEDETGQILFSQVYLQFCGLAYEVKSRRNAEFMSPTGIQFLFKQ